MSVYVGIDVHRKRSQVAVVTEDGTVQLDKNGLSHSAMVSWIASFADTYQALTSVWPVIYTDARWWDTCTGDYGGFASQDPLWMPTCSPDGSTLPAGWGFYTISQYAPSGTLPGDQDMFNGATSQLDRLAAGG